MITHIGAGGKRHSRIVELAVKEENSHSIRKEVDEHFQG